MKVYKTQFLHLINNAVSCHFPHSHVGKLIRERESADSGALTDVPWEQDQAETREGN